MDLGFNEPVDDIFTYLDWDEDGSLSLDEFTMLYQIDDSPYADQVDNIICPAKTQLCNSMIDIVDSPAFNSNNMREVVNQTYNQ